MKFCITESCRDFEQGIRMIGIKRNHQFSETGIAIEAIPRQKNILVCDYRDNKISITYRDNAHFFRGFSHVLNFLNSESSLNKEFYREEEVFFETNGVMFDCSRNGVLKTETIQDYILHMAMLGMNRLYLYLEDTYEVEEEPLFGAFRGRYSTEELKQCDAYASLFGIEMIPCIQTLAHLHTLLRYPKFKSYQDTADILLVGKEEVYTLIESMIRSLSRAFKSDYIHLGMDEAHDLGLGNYLKENGMKDRYQIMKEHLNRVSEICKKYNRKPMMWSDMFFRLGSPDGEYYEVENDYIFGEEQKPDSDMLLVYWDYYHNKRSHYKNYARLHQQLSKPIVFAGGGWTFNGVAPNLSWMEATSQAALTSLKEENVKHVFVTLWQDNGAETPLMAGLPALVLYAEHGFAKVVSRETINQRISFLWNLQGEAIWLLDKFDHTNGTQEDNCGADNPSKFLLYQDVLLGLFDGQIEGLNLGKHYKELAENLSMYEGIIFKYYTCLARLLSLKAELGIKIKKAYKNKDMEEIKHLKDITLTECIGVVQELSVYREKLWFAECKPNGFEVLDIRLAGLKKRMESAKKRLEEYLSGQESCLPELDEERICYHERGNKKLLSLNSWEYIVTAGNMAGI